MQGFLFHVLGKLGRIVYNSRLSKSFLYRSKLFILQDPTEYRFHVKTTLSREKFPSREM